MKNKILLFGLIEVNRLAYNITYNIILLVLFSILCILAHVGLMIISDELFKGLSQSHSVIIIIFSCMFIIVNIKFKNTDIWNK